MIKSDKFGGVSLSGDDAKTFARQVQFGRASKAAQETLHLGDMLLQRHREGATEVKQKDSVVKAAVAMEAFVKSNPPGTMPLEEIRALRHAVRALPPEWREGK